MHQVMVYHKEGEEVIDYLSGDPAHGYRVPLTRTEDKIEVTTEKELVEKEVELQSVVREKSGVYRIQVRTSGKDSFGKDFYRWKDESHLKLYRKTSGKRSCSDRKRRSRRSETRMSGDIRQETGSVMRNIL